MCHPYTEKCKTLEDYLLLYRTYKYDNTMRQLVYLLCNEMWGQECMGTLEAVVMEMVGLKYSNTLVSGAKVKTRRSHGSIKIMFNRLRQTMFVDRFR